VLIASCGAHLIQDGLVALQYVLLPILAQIFGLNYTQVGLLRALSNSAMTLLEIPAGVLSERFGETRLLVFGLLCAARGYLGVAFAVDFYLMLARLISRKKHHFNRHHRRVFVLLWFFTHLGGTVNFWLFKYEIEASS